MNVTTDTEPPPYTPTTIKKPPGTHDYLFVVGFFFTTLLLFGITYVYYICKRNQQQQQQPPHDTNGDADNRHLIRLSQGLDDDVLVTLPTSVYSETKMPNTVANGSGCSICLVDYMPADVVRMLPKCGHLFHVGCIDTWFKTHPTCPMCRNTPVEAIDRIHLTS